MTQCRMRLLPTALLSVPVFGVSLLWGIIVQVGEWAALGGSPEMAAVRVLLLSAVQILMFAFPFATWRMICPHVKAKNWNWLLLVSVLAGAVVRGIALGLLLALAGVTESSDLPFRIVASITHMAVIVIVLWFLVSEVRGLNARRRLLISERDQLWSLQQVAEQNLERQSDRATAAIRRSIRESLGDLTETSSIELRERLRVTIDEVVRPLSHQLAAQPSMWMPPKSTNETTRVDWALAIREGLDPARIHPVIVPVLLVWLGLPIHMFQFGPVLTAGLIATLLVAIPAFWIARIVATRLTEGRGAAPKAVAFVIATLSGGLALGLATVPYMQDQAQPFLFVVVGPLLALLVSGPLAVAETARDQDRELESDLIATTADLRWTVARARERYRQQERALAHALHGRLQASLSSAFLRLDRAMARGGDDESLLHALQSEVSDAIADLDVIDFEPVPLDTVLERTRSNWSGAVRLNFYANTDVREALMDDPLCARSINDLMPELVFNSVRHGNASAIDVRLELSDPRIMCLSVTDNGIHELKEGHHGLGSALLDECSITWTRTRVSTRTTTTCLLPFLGGSSDVVTPERQVLQLSRNSGERRPHAD